MSKSDLIESQLAEDSNLSTSEQTTSKYAEPLLNEVNFQRLRQLQQEIFANSEMTPSFRKLINGLITPDNLQTLKSKLLKDINE